MTGDNASASLDRRSAPAQTPVTVVTGFLGSGKTTMIARLLRQPGLANTAVIVNEFGEVGLDHMLMERLEGDVVLLPQGCVCCMVDGTVAGTLEGLDTRRIMGEIPMFDRVIIETTGLANPAPVLQTLLDRKVLLRGYTPGLVVTTVDAAFGAGTLDRHAEAVQQVAMADRLLLTKPDLETGPELRALLAELNPSARVIPVLHGEIDPAELTRASADDLALLTGPRRGRFAATGGHTSRIATVSLTLAEEVEFTDLADFLGAVADAYGPRLLRAKGIVRIKGEDRPLAVHGVQHMFHPPTRLAAWPPGLRHSTLVLILDGGDRDQVIDAAREFGLLPSQPNMEREQAYAV
jgi:Ni2+-binding GTPase involved in maturation of urease and hydrogenase